MEVEVLSQSKSLPGSNCLQDSRIVKHQLYQGARYKKVVTPVLSRPTVSRQKRKRRTPPTTVRRSTRINGRLAGGASVKTQQRTLMIQLGIAREGEVIGDEAMQAYLELFSRPLQQSHIAAIVGLFGWQVDVLPLDRDVEGVAL
ncbi:hypothetical protein VPH35_060543 [Triticum aestivum]|uniref:Uncharacterized protein n=1 Tax=Aegilops tauschii TaxID=37682 RepID=R7WAB4_AEGTA